MSCADAGPLAPAGAQRPTLEQERRLWRAGHEVVAGLDEVGRGAWAGPLTVGVACCAPDPQAARVAARLQALERRSPRAGLRGDRRLVPVLVGRPRQCRGVRPLGMTAALRLASYRALAGLDCRADALLVDGPSTCWPPPAAPRAGRARASAPGRPGGPATIELPEVGELPLRVPVVDGDARCAAVAAASVLAKVTRDRLMREESAHFPAYCFDANKGYPRPCTRWPCAATACPPSTGGAGRS